MPKPFPKGDRRHVASDCPKPLTVKEVIKKYPNLAENAVCWLLGIEELTLRMQFLYWEGNEKRLVDQSALHELFRLTDLNIKHLPASSI